MEINKEALEQLSIADIKALLDVYESETYFPEFGEYEEFEQACIEMCEILRKEIATRRANIFIL
jgi:hypothetical protein